MTDSVSANKGILNNIRILDLSWVLAGPYATRMLADFGAEVIKIQPPLPQADDEFSHGYYNTWNRNKLSITLNLDKPEGKDIFKKLVSISDAVVENFAPRVMANWELDYFNIKKIKHDIIMLGMSVMGNTGPWRDYTGFGPTVQAFSGLTYLSSFPGNPPMGLGYSYADHTAGLTACLALLGALEYRRKTGEGQQIDISEMEAMAYLLGDAVTDYILTGMEPKPTGNSSPYAAPHEVYRCRGNDRWCAIAVFTDDEWVRFRKAIGNPSWIDNSKFASMATRIKNSAELDRLVEEWTIEHTVEEVMTLLQNKVIAAGAVQDASDLVNDSNLKERGFFINTEHPDTGTTVSDASPIKFSDTIADYSRAAPEPDQDNEYVYRKLLDMNQNEIIKLRETGVI